MFVKHSDGIQPKKYAFFPKEKLKQKINLKEYILQEQFMIQNKIYQKSMREARVVQLENGNL